MQEVKRDRYDLIVGEVFVAAPTAQQPKQERLLDYEQVAAGMAYVYSRYVGECPNGDSLSRGRQRQNGLSGGVGKSEWDEAVGLSEVESIAESCITLQGDARWKQESVRCWGRL